MGQIHPPQPINQQLRSQCHSKHPAFPQESPQSLSKCNSASIGCARLQQHPSRTNSHPSWYARTDQLSRWPVHGSQHTRRSARPTSVQCEFRPFTFALVAQSEVVFREARSMDDPDVPDTPPLLLTESQAAKRLGISRSTLRRWRKDGCAPAHLRIGNILRYSDSDLQSFIKAHLNIAEVA